MPVVTNADRAAKRIVERVVQKPPARPTQVRMLHRGSPAFSKARRERNKERRLQKLRHGFGQKLPHGRQQR